MPSQGEFVDIHAHLLPGVDDGPEDIDTSLALIEQGLKDGIGTWVATPHIVGEFKEKTDSLHRMLFATLQEEVRRRGFPAELYLASELMYRIDAQTIKQRKSGTFAGNGTFFLMEFPMMQFPSEAEDALFEYQLAGLRPIIAHPERNADLAREPKLVDALAKRGILFQVNARSLSGSARSEDRFAAETMLRMGAIHFVASDAHHPDVRPARLREAFDRVCELAGEDRARALFITNPRAAIAGDRVFEIGVDPSKNIPWWQRIPGFGKVHGSDD